MHEAIKASSSSEAGPATPLIAEAFMQTFILLHLAVSKRQLWYIILMLSLLGGQSRVQADPGICC